MFVEIAKLWYMMTAWAQDPLASFWSEIVTWPLVGKVILFLEETFGRGATI